MDRVLEIVHRDLDALIPYAKNSRAHTEAQVDQIVASIREFGFTNPVLIDENGGVIAGHGRVLAARKVGMVTVPCIVLEGLTDDQRRAYVIADNKLALNADWNIGLLAEELKAINETEFDLSIVGFSKSELDALLSPELPPDEGRDEAAPRVAEDVVSVPGDVWILGKHRVMCGDSTSITDVEKLMNGSTAQLLHADPPYGMGKQADGVANDNIYGDSLDEFQMEWWVTYRTFLDSNASAYIWGNAPDLWRLWWRGGLADSERLELRNEIVWDKKNIAGMASPDLTQYPIATERCLFFQLGNQFIGNVNTDEFPESWEALRSYFASEAESAGIKAADIKRVCGCGMFAHWFTKSQYTLMPWKHYEKLRKEYAGRFARPWSELKAEWDRVRYAGREVIHGKLEGVRSYFDNAHDVMRDVWEFPRVVGDERFGHATPKPVSMMERIMRSSLNAGAICVEPFGGSGATLIGAEKTGRVCYSMELQGKYVDVIVRRWEKLTGKKSALEGDGRSIDEVASQRGTVKAAA